MIEHLLLLACHLSFLLGTVPSDAGAFAVPPHHGILPAHTDDPGECNTTDKPQSLRQAHAPIPASEARSDTPTQTPRGTSEARAVSGADEDDPQADDASPPAEDDTEDAAPPPTPETPQTLLQRGAYDDALALLSEPDSLDDHLLRTRILILTGQYADAEAALTAARATFPDAIPLQAEHGRVLALLGKPKDAEHTLLAITNQLGDTPRPGELLAMLYLLQLYERFYRLEDIHIESEWIFDYYAHVDNETLSPEAAYVIGVGAAIAGDEFNGIKVAALAQKRDPDHHAVTLAIGDIFRKKYHYADARREYNRVLQTNPKHPDALLGMAWIELAMFNLDDAEEQARAVLAVNPKAVDAHLVLATTAVYDRRFDTALAHCEDALAIRPADPRILERKAVLAYLAGQDEEYQAIRQTLAAGYAPLLDLPVPQTDLAATHPPAHAALLVTLSEMLARTHRVDEALAFAREAVQTAPDSAAAQVQLGTMLMRNGREEEAEEVLATAFRLDPYHVMIHNFRTLLRRNAAYEKTEHGRFLIRMPKEDAAIFGEDVARLAEDHLSRAEATYGYDVDRTIRLSYLKSQADFAARVTGLPRFDADGAAFGPFVAIVTPADGLDRSYPMNWASVQLHELAHVATLIGSAYRIPRWLTEGMSVYLEGWHHPSRDAAFQTLLAEGIWPDVRTWDRSFLRPHALWEIAGSYKAAGLFVEWFRDDYGADALARLVPLYAEGLSTEEVFQTVTGASIDALNKWFHSRLRAYDKTLHTDILVNPEDHAAMRTRLAGDPDDVAAAVYLLRLLRMRGDADGARELAEGIRDKTHLPNQAATLAHRLAYETLVELEFGQKNDDACRLVLEEGRTMFPTAPRLVHFSGLLARRAEDPTTAEAAFREAIRLYPRFLDGGAFENPYQALANLLHEADRSEELAAVLRTYTDLHRADPVALRWLAEVEIKREEWTGAAWALARLFAIDPYSSSEREAYATVLDALGDTDGAARQRKIVQLCSDRETRLQTERDARDAAPQPDTDADAEDGGVDGDLPLEGVDEEMDPNLQQLLDSLYVQGRQEHERAFIRDAS